MGEKELLTVTVERLGRGYQTIEVVIPTECDDIDIEGVLAAALGVDGVMEEEVEEYDPGEPATCEILPDGSVVMLPGGADFNRYGNWF